MTRLEKLYLSGAGLAVLTIAGLGLSMQWRFGEVIYLKRVIATLAGCV